MPVPVDRELFRQRCEEVSAWATCHGCLPRKVAKDEEERRLGSWLSSRLNKFRQNQLDLEQVEQLLKVPGLQDRLANSLVFVSWDTRCQELSAFVQKRGRLPVRKAEDEVEASLAAFMARCQQMYRKGCLSKEQMAALSLIPGVPYRMIIWENLRQAFLEVVMVDEADIMVQPQTRRKRRRPPKKRPRPAPVGPCIAVSSDSSDSSDSSSSAGSTSSGGSSSSSSEGSTSSSRGRPAADERIVDDGLSLAQLLQQARAAPPVPPPASPGAAAPAAASAAVGERAAEEAPHAKAPSSCAEVADGAAESGARRRARWRGLRISALAVVAAFAPPLGGGPDAATSRADAAAGLTDDAVLAAALAARLGQCAAAPPRRPPPPAAAEPAAASAAAAEQEARDGAPLLASRSSSLPAGAAPLQRLLPRAHSAYGAAAAARQRPSTIGFGLARTGPMHREVQPSGSTLRRPDSICRRLRHASVSFAEGRQVTKVVCFRGQDLWDKAQNKVQCDWCHRRCPRNRGVVCGAPGRPTQARDCFVCRRCLS